MEYEKIILNSKRRGEMSRKEGRKEPGTYHQIGNQQQSVGLQPSVPRST